MQLPIINQLLTHWNQWTSPPEYVADPEKQKQAQLLLALLLGSGLGVLPLNLLFDFVGLYGVTSIGKVIIDVCAIFIVCGLFFIAKNGHHEVAAKLFILFISGFIFANAIVVQRDNGLQALYYGFVIMLFGNLFLTARWLMGFISIHVMLILIYGIVVPEIDFEALFTGPFLFTLVMIGVASTGIKYRNEIEEQRKQLITLREDRYRRTSELISDYAFSYKVVDEGQYNHKLIWSTGDTYANITGYTEEERQKLANFSLYHEDDRSRHKIDLQRVIDGETVAAEYRINTKSGETRWVEIIRKPVWNEAKDKVIEFYGVVHDITNRKNDEFRQLEIELQKQRAHLLGELVQAISHDFRTSVATIETSRYLIERVLSEAEGDFPIAQRRLDTIKDAITHLTEQLDNLRTVHAVTEPHFELCRVNDLVELSIIHQNELANEKQVTLVKELGEDLALAQIDQQEFKVALDNLIKNAIHHSPKHSQVRVRTGMIKGNLCIDIIDTGSGIEAEKIPHIFELFYRADSARSLESGGVGLGLTIVKMIVDAHQGNITVESVVGEGTTFSIQLPASDAVELQPEQLLR